MKTPSKPAIETTATLAGDVEALCSILARIVARIVKQQTKAKA